jgi:zinc transport system substrate-binding protein
MHQLDTKSSRRSLLKATAAAGVASLAGCTSSGSPGKEPEETGPIAVASFFSFYDFGQNVAEGTPLTVKNLVPTGLHGHGWEPNASITRQIITADAFVHVGEDFQPWADRAIQTLKDDNADTLLIDVRDDIELVELAASLDREEGVGQNQGRDPHFWLDPQRAKQAVDNLTDGFVQLLPEYESSFRENADRYKTTVLDRIDREYAVIFDSAPRDVVQLAAHNAFQYMGVRYGVEMRPLVVNLAASGDIKPSDITEAKAVIEENNINYIGAAVFETRRPAQQLLAETSVEAYFPVTPYAGVRQDWVDQGWGYEEIAYNINMPTFEVVLGNKSPDEAGPTGWGEMWRNFE